MDMVWTVAWALVGGTVIGVLARLLLPGRQRVPFWAVVAAGIVGMIVGDWLAGLLGVAQTAGVDWIRHGLQVVVALAAVALVAAVFVRGSGRAGIAGPTRSGSRADTIPPTLNPPTVAGPPAGPAAPDTAAPDTAAPDADLG